MRSLQHSSSSIPRTLRPRGQWHRRFPQTHCRATVEVPSFVSSPLVREISDPIAIDMIRRYRSVEVEVPGHALPVRTAFVGPELEQDVDRSTSAAGAAPILLLHGFDNSCLEFRRLYPMLSRHVETFALDVLGSGHTDVSAYAQDPTLPLGPEQIRGQIYSFWKQMIGRPITLCGASLGGTMAMDFALEYPEAVERLVLIGAQGYIDGIGPMADAPRFVARLGAEVLKLYALRDSASRMSYFAKEVFATRDATLVGSLHTSCPGWAEAKVAFIMAGGMGFTADRIQRIRTPSLVLWGRQDGILDPKYARQFEADLPDSQVVMFDDCGHLPHVEHSEECGAVILRFCGVRTMEGAPIG